MTRGPLIILSGPSGSGKSTLIGRLLERHPEQLHLSVSATTRPPRPGELDGRDYYFWTTEQFDGAVREDRFVESACVHGKHCYGTLRTEVDPVRDRGVGVVLDIDVAGAAQVRPQYPDHLSAFITLPSLDTYRQRLLQRKTETPEWIERRMQTAREELKHAEEYQHVIVNDDLERAVDELDRLVMACFAGPVAG
jgi:guanylate kinase